MKGLIFIISLNVCCLVLARCQGTTEQKHKSLAKKEQYFSGSLVLKKINVIKDSSYARVVTTSADEFDIERLMAIQTSWNQKTIVILESKQGNYVEVGGSHSLGFYAKLVTFDSEGNKNKVGVLNPAPKKVGGMIRLLWSVCNNETEFNEKYDWVYSK